MVHCCRQLQRQCCLKLMLLAIFFAECTASKILKACLGSDQNFAHAFCSTGQVTDDETRPHLICSFGHLLCCLSQLESCTKHATKHRSPDATKFDTHNTSLRSADRHRFMHKPQLMLQQWFKHCVYVFRCISSRL